MADTSVIDRSSRVWVGLGAGEGEQALNPLPAISVADFETHLLMTMKLRMRMSHREAQLESKLADHGLTAATAEELHRRIADDLGDEASYFGNLRQLLDASEQDSTSLKYESVLWPGFTFEAVADEDGYLELARYRRTSRGSLDVDSPIGLAIWSMDVAEFTEQFRPTNAGRKWSLFDPLLPAYEEYEFHWHGESYGAGFSWGLFMFTAMSWD